MRRNKFILIILLFISLYFIGCSVKDLIELKKVYNQDNKIIIREFTEIERYKIHLFIEGIKNNLSVEDIHLLQKIATAESGFSHFDKNGNVMKGKYNKKDIGIFQINEFYHSQKAKELGLNIYNPYDNIKYAVYLYKNKKTKPWIASSKKWSKL